MAQSQSKSLELASYPIIRIVFFWLECQKNWSLDNSTPLVSNDALTMSLNVLGSCWYSYIFLIMTIVLQTEDKEDYKVMSYFLMPTFFTNMDLNLDSIMSNHFLYIECFLQSWLSVLEKEWNRRPRVRHRFILMDNLVSLKNSGIITV